MLLWQDIMDAKRVAQKLDIDHKILYYQNKFKQGVIDNFIESYSKGETPIPCVQCNQTVKFKDLFEVSKDLKADAMITGHYVKSITQIIKLACTEQLMKIEIKAISYLIQPKIN